jgi:hypothetical protein
MAAGERQGEHKIMRNRTVFLFSVALAALVLCFAVSGPAEAVDFGNVPLGKTATVTIDTSDAIAVTGTFSVTFTGPDAGDFSVGPLPNNVGKFLVMFTPTALGTRTSGVNAGWSGGSTDGSLTQVTGVGVAAVTIDTQPQSQTVCSGSTASFMAAASGTSAPTVQWQVSSSGGSSWSNIPGATNTTLSVFADATDGGNQYHAVFTNSDGTATSDAATLTVNPRPSALLFGLGTITVCAGKSVELSVTLSGTPPWSVTWSDGVVQSGITTSPLLRSVTPLSTTTYRNTG